MSMPSTAVDPTHAQVNYWPSTVEKKGETNSSKAMAFEAGPKSGQLVKEDLPKATADPDYDLYQVRDRWQNEISQDEGRSARPVSPAGLTAAVMAQLCSRASELAC